MDIRISHAFGGILIDHALLSMIVQSFTEGGEILCHLRMTYYN